MLQEFTFERLSVVAERLTLITEEVSFEQLQLKGYCWAHDTLDIMHKEINLLDTKKRDELILRLGALEYAYPEFEKYNRFRFALDSIIEALNSIDDCVQDAALLNKLEINLLNKVIQRFGLTPKLSDHVRLFKVTDCIDFATPMPKIDDLRKAIYVIANELLNKTPKEDSFNIFLED